MEKIKVIYYNSTLLKGGTDTYMLELIKNINKDKFHVDVLIKDGDNIDQTMFDVLSKLGCCVNLAKGSFLKRMMFLANFFKSHKNYYNVCHINATSQGTGIISYFAKKYGKINKVIFHSHMGGNDNGTSIVDKIGKKLMFKYSTNLASCSKVASKFMFFDKKVKNKPIMILNNSVDTSKFKYSEHLRQKIRNELHIDDDEFVIIHIGRFARQKNHERLLEIFAAVKEINPKSKLIMIGAGDLVDNIKALSEKLNITSDCLFLGLKNNVNDYMQAADCFVMPSFHEGLPIVAVEAQAAGLPCILSRNISTETQLTDHVEFVSLAESNEIWANIILNAKNDNRKQSADILTNKNFDHSSAIKVIENLYSN